MKRFFCKHAFFLLAALLVLPGCSSKENKEFKLTIVVADRLGDSSSESLPQELVDLCLPITDCATLNLIPKPTLVRLGFGEASHKSLSAKIKKRFAGNLKNPRLLKREIEKHLQTISIGEMYAQPNPSTNLRATFNSFLETIPSQAFVILYGVTSSSGRDYGYPIVNTIDSVRSAIGKELCEKGLKQVFVFMNPPLAPPRLTPISLEEEAALQELARRNEEAGKIQDEKIRQVELMRVYTELEEKSKRNPQNWRIIYELMKNKIYGKYHHEAFDLLKQAAAVAIETGEARYLLDLIEEEKDGALWKLSHGHDHDWGKIMKALTRKDASVLEEHETSELAGKH